MRVGVPELAIIVFVSLLTAAVPLAIAAWLIVTLVRLRSRQQALESRIDALERGRQS